MSKPLLIEINLNLNYVTLNMFLVIKYNPVSNLTNKKYEKYESVLHYMI
jgi:hypothetical protein